MNLEGQESELIQKFLLDKLDASEKLQFEKLCENRAFRTEILQQMDAVKNLGNYKKDNLRNVLTEARLELMNEKEGRASSDKSLNKSRRKLIFGALGLLLLASISYFLLQNLNTKSSGDHLLFAEYYDKPLFEDLKRGTSNDIEEVYLDALMSYMDRDYKAAISKFQDDNDFPERHRLYLAISHLELNQFEPAQKLLREIKNSVNNSVSQAAEWYLALLNLKRNDASASKLLLSDIVKNTNHFYYTNALSLQTKLTASQ